MSNTVFFPGREGQNTAIEYLVSKKMAVNISVSTSLFRGEKRGLRRKEMRIEDTSSVKVESLAIWEKDDECGIIDPVKEPFSKLDMKWEVGADPLPVSDS
nr:hypothetical protein Iba_chr08fCG4030 [Ipomoea batatas]